MPNWLKPLAEDVEEKIYRLAKKELTLSQTGAILMDSHGVAQVSLVTANTILRIFKYGPVGFK